MVAAESPDKGLLDRLPLPLAQLYRRTLNAKIAIERHQAAYYLWEATLKLMASTAVVVYAERPHPDSKLTPLLAALARPQLGHWWAIARQLTQSLAQHGDAGFRRIEDFLLGSSRDDLPHMAGLDAPARCSERRHSEPCELFDHLVTYRNRLPGHGVLGMHGDGYYERFGSALRLAIEEFLGRVDPLAGRSLIYIGDVKQLAGGWPVDRMHCEEKRPSADRRSTCPAKSLRNCPTVVAFICRIRTDRPPME